MNYKPPLLGFIGVELPFVDREIIVWSWFQPISTRHVAEYFNL